MLFEQVLREKLPGGDDPDELVAGFGSCGDVVGEKIGVFIVPDYNGTKRAAVSSEKSITNGAKNRPIQNEKNKTKPKRIESNGSDRKEVPSSEKVKGNNRHHPDYRSEKEAADFFCARMARENTFRIESERGEDNNPDRNKNENFPDKSAKI